MNQFLKKCKSCLPLNAKSKVCLVIGNESCDLDSAISAICLAKFLTEKPNSLPSNNTAENCTQFLPVLNISRAYLPTKTEVRFFLKSNGIDVENVITNEDLGDTSKSKVILVDHHVSELWQQVIGVLDHRPFNKHSQIRSDCYKRIEEVGSCATLVADEILKSDLDDMKSLLNLLYGPILLDTVNFSKEADKAKELDYKIATQIELHLNLEDVTQYRQDLFKKLLIARSDVSQLNSFEILWKDLKIISNKCTTNVVAIPGYPIAVQDFIKLQDAESNVKMFADINHCDVIILMGMKVTNDSRVFRDIGFINIKNEALFNHILNEVKKADLKLEQHKDVDFLGGKYYNQINIKASRKNILPIIQCILHNEKK